MAIARIGEFRALAGQEDALAHFLASITPLILGSEGALSCQLFRDRDDAARLWALSAELTGVNAFA